MRKRMLIAATAVTALLLLVATATWLNALLRPAPALAAEDTPSASAIPGSDWPSFLGPDANGTSPEKGIIAPWPEKGLRVVWHKALGSGYGAPAVSQGRLFVFDRESVADPNAGGGLRGQRDGKLARLQCLDATTGKSLWTFDYPTTYRDHYGYNNGPRCCPVVDGNLVFIHGVEGMLHCVRADTGKLVWKVDTQADFGFVQNFFGVGSTPVVEGDLLLVQVGGSPAGSDPRDFGELKSNGSGLVAFDKRTGKVVYQVGDELASYAGPVLATIDGRRWCFLFARGGLLAFNPRDGKVDFQFPWRADILESVNVSNPVVVGDRVFLSETYGPGAAVLKVRPGGYDVLWSDAKKSRKTLACHWMTPIFHDGYLYGCHGRHGQNAELRCVEFATGKVMWTEPRLSRSSLLMVDGHFVCLTEDGVLRLLKVDPKKYDEISRMDVKDAAGQPLLDYPCWAAPILSHGLMYIRGEGRLVCLELIAQK